MESHEGRRAGESKHGGGDAREGDGWREEEREGGGCGRRRRGRKCAGETCVGKLLCAPHLLCFFTHLTSPLLLHST